MSVEDNETSYNEDPKDVQHQINRLRFLQELLLEAAKILDATKRISQLSTAIMREDD